MRLLAEEAGSGCPMHISEAGQNFDPFQPAYVENPYPFLEEIQKADPVFYAPSIGAWVVTRLDTVRSVLRDSKRFSPRIASDPWVPLCDEAKEIIINSEFDVPPVLVNNDSPRHPHIRKFFGEPLKPKKLAALQPFVTKVIDAQIDEMIAAGTSGDLASGLTWDVPALVLFHLLGIPDEDIPQVKEYADSRVILLWGRPTKEEQIRLIQGSLEFFRYTTKLVHSRVDNLGDDYPSEILRQRNGDDNLATIREIIAVTYNFLFAGHETTSSASANILSAILSEPGMWQGIVDGTLNVPKLVEEGLRFDPPVQAWRRLALEDVVLDGMEIPKGSHILLHFAAANRDPNKFDDPQTFQADRANANQHTSFGMGAHFCLGASLARMEIITMIERLAERLPNLKRVEGQVAEYLPNTSFRGLRRLEVTW